MMLSGTGFGNPVDPALGSNLPFDFLANFDPYACILAGSAVSFEVGFNDVFLWTVYKDSMSGPYSNTVDGVPLFKRQGRLKAFKV